MHMADALVSTPIAIGGGVVAATLIGIAASKVKKIKRTDIIPLMGVMGAFVFAAQMINFSIPGTGSSGHIIGGILLSAVLGPWAAFITLCSVIIIQCLVFADGGLLVLGCNIVNMAAMTCLVAYPLIYKPIAGKSANITRIIIASVLSSIVGLELGALGVTIETEMSGITALPFSTFLTFMLSIHLAIGTVEGIATALVICFIAKYSPETLDNTGYSLGNQNKDKRKIISFSFVICAAILAVAFTWIASSNPDGLEWSIEKVSGLTDLKSIISPTAVLPDYNSRVAGIIGATVVMVMIWAITSLLFGHIAPVKKMHRNK